MRLMFDRSAGGRKPSARILLSGCLAAALSAAMLPSSALAQRYASPGQVEEAVRSSSKSDRELRDFYKTRQYRPLWLQGSNVSPAAGQLLELIASAEIDGLDPDEYKPRALAAALERASEGSPKALARAEMLLSRTFVSYVRDLRRAPAVRTVYVDRELMPTPPSARAALSAAAAAPSLEAYVGEMGWMSPLYAGMRRALASRGRWESADTPPIPPGPMLKMGAGGERVMMLRQRLGLSPFGDFDGEVAAALRAFQAANGLPEDGVAGARTLAALNEGSGGYAGGDREEVIRLNLERARVLPAAYGRRHIVVDAAAARLYVYEDGQLRDSMKVVVGKSTEQTPMMAGLIRYAMVNPYWHIPPDLARVRAAEVLKSGPSYLKKKRYAVFSDWSDKARELDPKKVDWQAVASGRTEIAMRQLPGHDNAMGKMKFMLPNELGIYLHDTPERALFNKEERRFSSGCVRVEDAPRLAKWLFGRPLNPKAGASEQQVNMPQPVPVYITYLTAAPAGSGIAFRNDAYNRDAAQLARMGTRGYAAR